MKVGDLVQELVPLMAGDVPSRLGIITKVTTGGYSGNESGWYKVLFDKEEFVHYNSLRKMEA